MLIAWCRRTTIVFGAAAGTVGTVWAERKVKSQLDRARPVNLAESARRAVRVAIDEGRIAAREREIELRDRYRIASDTAKKPR